MKSGRRARVGELLIERGLIGPAELEAALSSQVVHGGRLGSNLVEMGMVSIDAVGDVLSGQLGVPFADPQRFNSMDDSVLAAIPGQVCNKYKILPLQLQGRTLHLGMIDPERRDLIDHLASALRVGIQPYVVPELRMLYWLERYHGIPRPKRFLRSASGQVANDRRKYLEATPVGGKHATVAPTAPAARTPTAPPAPQRSTPFGSSAGTSDEFELVYLDDVPHGATTPEPHKESLEWDIEVAADEAQPAPAPPPGATVSSQEVLQQLDAADSREAVVRALLQPVLTDTLLAVLILPRDDLGVVLGAWGSKLPIHQVRALVVPLNTGSMVTRAMSEKQPLIGDPKHDPIQSMMSTYLRTAPAEGACVVPICVGPKVVNLLCLQTESALPDSAPGTLTRLSQHTAAAYMRLIKKRKEATIDKSSR